MARLGRGFKNQDLANYFNSMQWYQATISPDLCYTEEVLSHFGAKPLFCYMTVKRRE